MTTEHNQDLIKLLLGRTPTAINRFLISKFKENEINITPEQWSILSILWEKEGWSQQQLANQTYRDRAAITRLVDNLEKEGLIVRKSDSRDRRLKIIHLTSKGKELEDRVVSIVTESINIAKRGVDESMENTVRSTFDIVYKNLTQENNE